MYFVLYALLVSYIYLFRVCFNAYHFSLIRVIGINFIQRCVFRITIFSRQTSVKKLVISTFID